MPNPQNICIQRKKRLDGIRKHQLPVCDSQIGTEPLSTLSNIFDIESTYNSQISLWWNLTDNVVLDVVILMMWRSGIRNRLVL